MNARFALPIITIGALALGGCVSNDASSAGTISVSSTADECTLTATSAPSGSIVFDVTNNGDDVTEFYLLAKDGLRIITEIENVGPGLSRELIAQVPAGEYITACKPGMVGEGIRASFTVTDSGAHVGPTGEIGEQLDEAAQQYVLYVRDQVQQLDTKTAAFLEAYTAGQDDEARAIYADARVHWERIEPVAEAFGDLDPSMDLREADLAQGQQWTGWHHMEKDLWPPAEGYSLTDAERQGLADQLAADTATLVSRVNADDFTVDAFQIGNGAKELLDEVATGKVTGEEEAWSHTDLWDFQANLDGASVAFGVLRPVLETTDPELVKELDARFDAVQTLLLAQGSVKEGFTYYDDLTDAEILELARAVDALGEPLSRMTAAAVL